MARQHHVELKLQAGPGDVGIPTLVDRLYSPNEAAIVLGVAVLDLREQGSRGLGSSNLEKLRYYGGGPRFHKAGKQVALYSRADLDQ